MATYFSSTRSGCYHLIDFSPSQREKVEQPVAGAQRGGVEAVGQGEEDAVCRVLVEEEVGVGEAVDFHGAAVGLAGAAINHRPLKQIRPTQFTEFCVKFKRVPT